MASLEQMRLAFAWNAAVEMIMADGDVAPEEAALVSDRYASRARTLGLVDADGRYTPLFKAALADAPAALLALPREERLALLGEIVDVVVADGIIDMAEADKVEGVTRALGLASSDVADLLKG